MRIPLALLGWLWVAAWVPAATVDVPVWFPTAHLLPPPRGEVIRVTTLDELFAAAERAEPGHTILLTDGDYKLPRGWALLKFRAVIN